MCGAALRSQTATVHKRCRDAEAAASANQWQQTAMPHPQAAEAHAWVRQQAPESQEAASHRRAAPVPQRRQTVDQMHEFMALRDRFERVRQHA